MDKQKKRWLKGILWAVILVVSIIGFWQLKSEFRLNPFVRVSFDNTSAITMGHDSSIYLVSESNRQVSKISKENQLIYQIKGGKRELGSFYLATEVETDSEGQLYILNSEWESSGAYISTESIMLYSQNGQFLKSIFVYQDNGKSHLFPVVKGLSYDKTQLNWFVLESDGIQIYTSLQDKPIGKIEYPDASLMVQDVKRLNAHQVVYITKNGYVYQYDEQKKTTIILLEPTARSIERHSNLWSLEIGQNQQIYINDIGQFGIYKLENKTLTPVFNSKLYTKGKDQVYFYFHVNEQGLIAVNDQTVVIRDNDNSIRQLETVEPSASILLYRILAWVFLLMGIVAISMLMHFGLTWLLRKIELSSVGKTLPILLAVTIAALLITMVAIDSYGKVIESQAINSLKLVVQNSKYVVDGDKVKAITNATNFYNEDYQQVSDQLQKLINYNQESWNENLYTALYTILDERYYALMYNDNRITPYYPFNAFTDDPKYDFFKNAYRGDITNGTEVDADGQWIFSMGPVYDKNGTIVAIVEVGMNKYIFDEWNQKVVSQIVVDIISMIIILILLVSEISFFTNWLNERKESGNVTAKGESPIVFNQLNVIRTVGLLTYVVIFMCTAFIPVMAKSIYQPLGNVPMSVALGLPIFFEVLFTAITILFAGVVAEKKGWRTIFYLGTVILILSAIATGFTRSLTMFIVIRSFAGIGNGFIQMTMYAFINVGSSTSQRNEAFAHMMSGAIAGTNLGIVLGANLADKIGYFNVFFVMAGFGLLAIVFERVFLRQYETMASEIDIEMETEIADNTMAIEIDGKGETGMSWVKFFTRLEVVVFFILILVPAFLCYMYLEYFFPIFAEAQGLSTSTVGIVFSLYGLFIVYLGPTFSTWSERYLGTKNATALASVLTGVSLLVFAMSGSLGGAIVAVLVLALSDSFGETVYTTYFLALKASQQVGKSIAAGYLEFVSQIGKMLGALAFGIAIGFGEQLGIGVIGLITLGMSIIFYFASLGKASQ